MTRVLVTGSAGGLGRAAAAALLDGGHQVVVHARTRDRLTEATDLIRRGADTVVGDLADQDETAALADQVNRIGRMDTVIHNAGVYTGRDILPVNVIAPYLLTALIEQPARLVYLSSGMHRGGRRSVGGLDATGDRQVSYSDSKLLLTALAAAVARRWPDVLVNSVDPGWVPTRMGGPHASDDLELGHVTQVWLAVSSDPEARSTGGYWYHQSRQEPHPAVKDLDFQDEVLAALERRTGVAL